MGAFAGSLRATTALAAGVLVFGVGIPAYAASSLDAQVNNPQVSGDSPPNVTAVFPTNKQNEPSIAVNPRNAGSLIAGANDEQGQPPCGGSVRGPDALENDCSFFGDVGTSGVYTSADGGASWKNRSLLDAQAGWMQSAFVSDGDPVITFGPKPGTDGRFSWGNGTRAYYASLARYKAGRSPYPPQKAPELIAVSWSDDGGVTWQGPSWATTKGNPVDFNDKEWIVADTNESSPYFGRVYVSWTSFRQNTSEPVEVSYSADGGLTFSPPNQLSPAANTTKKGHQASQPVVGADGSVHVTFEQGLSHVVTTSRDGGVKWSRPAPAAAVHDLDDPIPGANFRTNSFSSFAADPSDANRLVLAWAERADEGGRIWTVRTSDKGKTWSSPVQVSTDAQGYAFYQGVSIAPNRQVDVGLPGTRGEGSQHLRDGQRGHRQLVCLQCRPWGDVHESGEDLLEVQRPSRHRAEQPAATVLRGLQPDGVVVGSRLVHLHGRPERGWVTGRRRLPALPARQWARPAR